LHVDIYGIDEDANHVIAQVTHGRSQSEVDQKLKLLEKYTDRNAIFIFFGPDGFRRDIPKMKYIAIEQVFTSLYTGDAGAIYQRLISKMLYQD